MTVRGSLIQSGRQVEKAVQYLKEDRLVGMPTETVYGLAGNIYSEASLQKIFLTKRRPFFDPLIVHVDGISMAQTLTTDWNLISESLAKKFWPGPLTLVLPKASTVSDLVTSGLPSVGIRCPRHSMALKLIQEFGQPLAAPSANMFGKTSPTSAAHVLGEFPQDDIYVLDGGDCEVGIESTVLGVRGTEIYELRKGMISFQEIRDFLISEKVPHTIQTNISKVESPGHMKHHYMPSVPLVVVNEALFESLSEKDFLNRVYFELQQSPDEIEGVTIKKPNQVFRRWVHLHLGDSPALASRSLYSELRKCASEPVDLIVFVVKEQHSSSAWDALRDRLFKAASVVCNS